MTDTAEVPGTKTGTCALGGERARRCRVERWSAETPLFYQRDFRVIVAMLVVMPFVQEMLAYAIAGGRIRTHKCYGESATDTVQHTIPKSRMICPAYGGVFDVSCCIR